MAKNTTRATSSILKFLVCFVALLMPVAAVTQTASLLPNAVQQFFDNNGNPLSGGTVTFYIPNTSTKKTIWQDSGQVTAWSNPITLDAAGRPPGTLGIYGNGNYRQLLKDKNGNTIWDRNTSSTGSGSSGTSTGDGDLVGTVKPWAGLVAPNQYVFAYGQEISRATYPDFLTATTLIQNIQCTSASPIITGLSDTTQIPAGSAVETTCLAPGATVVSKTNTTVTVSSNAVITTNTTATFFPYGNGNGSTTFNVVDLRGRVIPGRNNMGGVASANLTSTYYGEVPDAIGANGGSQSHTMTIAQMPAHDHDVNINSSLDGNDVLTALNVLARRTATPQPYARNTADDLNTAMITSTGGGQAFPIVQPSLTLNYIIKITPDANSSEASGVTALGGMTGSIACGTGLTCTSNIISISGALTIAAPSVTYTATGTGATAGNAQTQFDEGYTPQDFGAVCNDTADDTTAIQNAINAAVANNKNLLLKAGTCKITAQLTIAGSLRFQGLGPKISKIRTTAGGATTSAIRITASYVTLDGFALEGPTTASYVADEFGIHFDGVSGGMLSECYANNIEIHKFGSHGILHDFCQGYSLTNSYVHDVGYAGGMSYSSNDGKIQNNIISTVTPGFVGDAYGYAITELTGEPVPQGAVVSGNHVSNITTWECLDTHGGRYIVFANNVCLNTKFGINVSRGADNDAPFNITVVGNTIDSQTTGSGVRACVTVSGFTAIPAFNISITGNTCRRYGSTDIGEHGGIYLANTLYTTISGNTVTECQSHCIFFDTENANYTVTGNTLQIASTATANAAVIRWEGTNSGIVSGNTIIPSGEFAYYFTNATPEADFSTNKIVGTLLVGNLANAGDGLEISGATTWNPASIASGASDTTTITITGLLTSDIISSVKTSATVPTGLIFDYYVSGADTITLRYYNATAGAIDPASITYTAYVVTTGR